METVEYLEMTCPSDALTAMVHGLLTIPDDNFRVDMATFGDEGCYICFGCAATCALQDAAGIRFTPDNIRQRPETISGLRHPGNYYRKQLAAFEFAIDNARVGSLARLFGFFGMLGEHAPAFDGRFHLGTSNYRRQLGAVQELIDELEALGL